MSIFVNPIQFGPNEDFEKYPRDFERDEKLAENAGVDFIFYPEKEEMYKNHKTYITVNDVTEFLCGEKRPGHFTGVATVVLKLFNIIKPSAAVFGIKDAQQVRVIEKMVEDLNVDIKIIRAEIIREKSGLALSSRNKYLTEEGRKKGLILNISLKEAKQMIDQSFEVGLQLLNNRKLYTEKFLKILSPQQVLKLFDHEGQIREKMMERREKMGPPPGKGPSIDVQ